MSDASGRYGLTSGGKARTRPLVTAELQNLPPAASKEEAPGYIYYPPADIWVYADDYSIVIEVIKETTDSEIKSRHGTRTTKNQGCGGPLCKKALRDAMYGGARSIRLKRIEELLCLLQEQHDKEWFEALPEETKQRMLSVATDFLTRVGQIDKVSA